MPRQSAAGQRHRESATCRAQPSPQAHGEPAEEHQVGRQARDCEGGHRCGEAFEEKPIEEVAVEEVAKKTYSKFKKPTPRRTRRSSAGEIPKSPSLVDYTHERGFLALLRPQQQHGVFKKAPNVPANWPMKLKVLFKQFLHEGLYLNPGYIRNTGHEDGVSKAGKFNPAHD